MSSRPVVSDYRLGAPEASWKHSIIAPILCSTAPGGAERKAAVKKAAAVSTWPEGQRRGKLVGAATIYEWIKAYEERGLAGLMRKAREDRGNARVFLSRQMEAVIASLDLDGAAQAALRDKIRRDIRSLWAEGTPSWATVQLNAAPAIMALLRAAGCNIGESDLRRACLLPRKVIEAERSYQALAIRRKDAGRSAAIQTPRIRRDRRHLQPMEFVAADVHHIDIAIRRPDGSICTPKAVAWMDLATNRAFVTVFMMRKGEMIRREHVIESFVAMTADPNFGCPSNIYVDNGGEYNWVELAEDLCRLKQRTVAVRFAHDQVEDADKRHTLKSRPYNPQAKVIEALFAMMKKTAYAQIEGYIGGDRMKKKVENQGKPPRPYPGDWEAFVASHDTAVRYYHCKPQYGHLDGKAPADRFGEFVAAGWRSVTLDPAELAAIFCTKELRRIQAGGVFEFGGRRYRHDGLLSLSGTGRVVVHAPLFGDRHQLWVFDEDDRECLCIAEPEQVYRFDDPAGAGEQQRMASVQAQQFAAMRAEVSPVHLEARMAAVVDASGPKPVAASAATITVDAGARRAAEVARKRPGPKDGTDDEARRIDEQNEIYGRLLGGSGAAA